MAMGQFSDDGQWWWDGRQWIATSQIVIPDLAIPQPESLQRSMRDRSQVGEAANVTQAASLATESNAFGFAAGVLFLSSERSAFRELRQWTLEQLASASMHLLGPDEPMIAGEVSLYREQRALGFFYSTGVRRELAVVVTAQRVLLLAFDRFDGQPRWVALVARAREVQLQRVRFGWLGLIVRRGSQVWPIRGTVGVTRPEPVIDAWKAALAHG